MLNTLCEGKLNVTKYFLHQFCGENLKMEASYFVNVLHFIALFLLVYCIEINIRASRITAFF